MHKISLNYVSLADFLSRVKGLLNLAKLPRFDAIDRVKEMVEEKEAKTSFDTSWLEHLDEKPLREQYCMLKCNRELTF